MSSNKRKVRRRDEVIVETWQQQNGEPVGRSVLEAIRRALREEFGDSDAISPSSIARTLADEGAQLRHEEILRCDVEWRQRQLGELFAPGELNLDSVDEAMGSVRSLDELNTQLNSEGDEAGVARLRDLAIDLKNYLHTIATSTLNLGEQSALAGEVVQWLSVWLQTPHIFEDWLALRCSSEEFRRTFPNQNQTGVTD